MIKPSLFTDEALICPENQQNEKIVKRKKKWKNFKKLLEQISEFSKDARCKTKLQTLIAYFYIINNDVETDKK